MAAEYDTVEDYMEPQHHITLFVKLMTGVLIQAEFDPAQGLKSLYPVIRQIHSTKDMVDEQICFCHVDKEDPVDPYQLHDQDMIAVVITQHPFQRFEERYVRYKKGSQADPHIIDLRTFDMNDLSIAHAFRNYFSSDDFITFHLSASHPSLDVIARHVVQPLVEEDPLYLLHSLILFRGDNTELPDHTETIAFLEDVVHEYVRHHYRFVWDVVLSVEANITDPMAFAVEVSTRG